MWRKAYLETRVLSADPVELIGISYEFATLRVREARSALAKGAIAERCKAISKAIAILTELDSSLDHKQGGEIAFNLGRLYLYMSQRLAQALVKQTDEPLAEVESLLDTLGGAWRAIGPGLVHSSEEVPDHRVTSGWNAFARMDSRAEHYAHVWDA